MLKHQKTQVGTDDLDPVSPRMQVSDLWASLEPACWPQSKTLTWPDVPLSWLWSSALHHFIDMGLESESVPLRLFLYLESGWLVASTQWILTIPNVWVETQHGLLQGCFVCTWAKDLGKLAGYVVNSKPEGSLLPCDLYSAAYSTGVIQMSCLLSEIIVGGTWRGSFIG